MKCPVCGTDNREGARFCRQCGAGLADVAAAPAPVAEEPAPAREGGQPSPDQAAPAVGDHAEAESPAEPVEGAAPAEADAAALPEPEPEHKESTEEAEGLVEEPAGEAEPEAGAPQPSPERKESTREAEGPVEEPVEGPGTAPEEPGTPVAPGPGAEAEGVSLFFREAAEPLVPLEPGALVAGRYRLVTAMDLRPGQILYEAEDLRACWQCGFEGNADEDAFCAQCGADLDAKRRLRLLQVGGGQDQPSLPAGSELSSRLEHEGGVFFVVTEPAAPAGLLGRDLRLVTGYRSDTGRVRELNEDSLLAILMVPIFEGRATPLLALFAVADGMGGHEGGEIASKLALRVLAEHVTDGMMLPELGGEPLADEELLARLRSGIVAANDAVYLARQKQGNDMGTTLTATLVCDARLFVAHVGDSRAYLWHAGGLEQLTTDHSVVASMIANGQAAPEEIYSHPHRSVVYRSIGDKPSVEVDTQMRDLAAGDRLIVCSDGLWETVRDEGIADMMLQEAEPQAACDLLVKHANLAGGEDNITIIVVAVQAV